jgi:[acyl-carrier-protein] S-malonyltransferase/trans-AT polyketide synthase/acyltransferase/oxidoreductase domain-containing protein
MAAVIADRLDVPAVLGALEDLPVDLANDNSSDQIVISGDAKAMTEAEERIRNSMGNDPSFRFVPLNVSAPFHSRYMAAIEKGFRDVLRGIEGQVQPANAKRVTSNVTGLFHSDNRAEIVDRLVTQLSNTVRWRKNMETLAAAADFTVEIGPGRPLRGFFKTMGVACQSVTTLSGARKVFEKGTGSQKPS